MFMVGRLHGFGSEGKKTIMVEREGTAPHLMVTGKKLR